MKYTHLLAFAMLSIFLPAIVHAQNLNHAVVPYEAQAAFSAWNSSFLTTQNGQTFYSKQLTSVKASNLGGWGEALDIAVAEDHYEATHSPAALKRISALMDSFGKLNGTNWSGDTWNDDLGWMVNAYLRAYQITGNPSYLSIAELNWNTAYNRGWDDVLGGGIYENMQNKQDKLCLSNDNFVWEGVGIYEATGDKSYLTKAENIYAWVRTHLFNPTNVNNAVGAPGRLRQGEEVTGKLESGDNLYNNGTFLEAANALHQVTGNAEYYHDAIVDINHVIGSGPIMKTGDEGTSSQWAYWFIKGLSDFCTDNNLWPKYYPWMLANANAAWSERNSLGLTWNDWTNPTSSSKNTSMVMSSAVAIWQLLDVPQQYKMINKRSRLAMDLIGGETSAGAAIEEKPFHPGTDADQQWTIVHRSSGNDSIISSLNDEAASANGDAVQTGAQLTDTPYSMSDPLQQFAFVSEGSVWREIKNVNSGLAFADNGGRINQATADGKASQLWKFVPVVSFGGKYEIECVQSHEALSVSAAAASKGAAVSQEPYHGRTNQLWTFTPTSMGCYKIMNDGSGQNINIAGDSYATGAAVSQQPGGKTASEQWTPVQNTDGTYSFFNLNSGLVLDDPGSSMKPGTQFDQWGWSGNANQEFKLIAK